jgi:hypothetical protein
MNARLEISEMVRRALSNMPDADAIAKVAHRHTISRELAHKRRLENVYVTSLCEQSEGEFLFGAFVPQSNAYINDMRTHANDVTLSLVEIGRQIGIALSHEFLGVGHGNAFVLDQVEYQAFAHLQEVDWRANETLWGHLLISNRRYSAEGELVSAQADGAFFSGDQCVARQSSAWTICPKDRYVRLREIARNRAQRRTPAADDAALPFAGGFKVGLHTALRRPVLDEVLWANREHDSFSATLHVERENLFFFDHENDHVPGMLLLEGMRRLALDIAGRYAHHGDAEPAIGQMQLEFKNFAELDSPVQLLATQAEHGLDAAPPGAIHIEARQFGRVVASGSFAVA